jgi:glycosyltransferase involved in cell wall biosynthesis
MRIVLLLTSLGVGGAERQVVWLSHRLARRGHAVRLVVLLPRNEGDWPVETGSAKFEVTFLNIRKRPWSILRGLARGAAEIRRFRPDLLHGHNFHGNLAVRLLGSLCGVPVISTIHNVYEGGWQRMLAYGFTDVLSKRTIAVSEAAHERYVRLRAVAARKAGVIPNGIETAKFVPDAEQRKLTRAAMGVTDKDFVWIAVGRLTPAKDYPNMLRAFALLPEACAAAPSGMTARQLTPRLWIVGYGDAAYAEDLRALARELGIEESIRWLGMRHDIPALLDAADGFVLSSAWEGMPLAMGEAMAMQKPVVATDVGGVRELGGEAGWLTPPGNPGALAGMMGRMMALSDWDRARIGEAARARVLRLFGMEAKAREWEELYRTLVSMR